MSKRTTVSRRTFLKTSAATAAGVLGAPYVKNARSAGKLKLGLWDHWVPGANAVLEQILTRWGERNGVEVTVDFITSIGNKLLLTAQAESRAGSGHDVLSHGFNMVPLFKHRLVPVDDVVEEILATQGEIAETCRFSAFLDGAWRGSPAPTGTLSYPTVARRDLFLEHTGIDLEAWFPASGARDPVKIVGNWNWDTFLEAAAALHGAGRAFGAPLAATPDGSAWMAHLFASYGAALVDEHGDIVVDSDPVREVLEYVSRLAEFMPDSVYAWDDASNNRWLISGEGSAIFNPPSAWAVARRDSPEVARHIWHFDVPRGPAGRFRALTSFFWGIWDFSENQAAARDLLRYVARPEVVTTMLQASQGFDLPLIRSHYERTEVWSEAAPPRGVLHNYALRGDERTVFAGYPAPPEIGARIATQQLLPTLAARVTRGGESITDAIGWAENELEGVLRG